MAANGAQYGVATVNYYWIGAIPAMVFLGLVMMPFYYGSKVRSVPEYLKLRFNNSSHIFNSVTFAIATILIAGVNLYALALVLELMLGWPIRSSSASSSRRSSSPPTSASAGSRRRSTTRCCSSSSSSPR
jgi:Na+/proline symporter